MRKLILLLLLCASMYAQNPPPDACMTMGRSLTSDPACQDIDPGGFFTAVYKEWDTATGAPITNDPTIFWVEVQPGSGAHPHYGTEKVDGTVSNNPIDPGNRPLPSLSVYRANTDMAGTITFQVKLWGYSGTYTINGNSLANKIVTGGAFNPAFMYVGAHWVPPSLRNTTLQNLTSTLQPHISFVVSDNTHSGGIYYVRSDTIARWQLMGLAFYQTTSGGLALPLGRCAIGEGGVADNDLGANFSLPNTGVLVPGKWGYSWRLFEDHSSGIECDVINPSVPGDTVMYTKAAQVIDASVVAGCSMGRILPGSVFQMVPPTYWKFSDEMHVICGHAGVVLPIPQ